VHWQCHWHWHWPMHWQWPAALSHEENLPLTPVLW
jgi:hypothetical protein